MTDGFWIFLLPFKTFSFFIKVPLSASKSPRALVTWPSPVQPRRRARGRDQLLGSCFKSRRVYHINNRGVTPSECLLLSVFRIPEIPQSSRSKGTARTQIIRCSIVISLRGHGLLLEPLCGRVKRELSTVRGPRSEEKQLLGEYERSTTDRCWTSLNILTATHYSEDCVRRGLESGRR